MDYLGYLQAAIRAEVRKLGEWIRYRATLFLLFVLLVFLISAAIRWVR